jgi:hypothetical protein
MHLECVAEFNYLNSNWKQVFVADVSGSSQFATVHVAKNVLILAPFVTLVTRV